MKQYHCKICGEPLQGTESECPNCHTPLGSATMRVAEIGNNTGSAGSTTRLANVSASSGAADRQEGTACPRCGEILMPGANVCEFCGEVIHPIRPSGGASTQTLYAGVEDLEKKAEPLPTIINTHHSVGSTPSANDPRATRLVDPNRQQQKRGSVTTGMLIVICVLAFVIAGSITWAILHFMRSNDKDVENDYAIEQTDVADTQSDIGFEETEPQLPSASPSAPSVAQERTTVTDGDNVPIEGMRESLAGTWTYYGKINNKFNIGIDLKIEPDGNITGSYWYESTLRQNGDVPSTYINLEGDVDDTGTVKLTAYKYGENKPSEYWTGRMKGVTPLRFDGTFRSASKATTYTFATATR